MTPETVASPSPVTDDEAPPPVEVAPKKKAPTLTKRASMTAVASLLDYAVKAIVGLVVTPILVSGLGRSVYGMWEMISRLGSYLSATDGRPTEALRLVITQHQADPDPATKRRFVGASIRVWFIMLPMIAAAGAFLIFYLAPTLTKAQGQTRADVMWTVSLIVAGFALTSLAQIPESVLRGMNLGYRRMGLQSALNILGGGCAALAVWTGTGLVGLGGAQIIRIVATGLVFWMLVKKYVPWFGVAKPERPEVKALLGMSIWLAVGDAIAKIVLASDILILGAVLAPAIVTTYVLTSYAARTAVGIHVFTAGAAIPGLGGLLGKKEIARATQARHELLLLTWLYATIVGGAILVGNEGFVKLWVGHHNYAGIGVDLLIVLATVQTMFIRVDSYIIDANLQPKLRVVVAAVAAVITIGMSIALTRAFGIMGLTTGVILGRLVQTVAYPIQARRCLGPVQRPAGAAFRMLRLAAISGVVFAGAAWLGHTFVAPNWLLWAAEMAVTLMVVTPLAFALGTTAKERKTLLGRARTLRARRGTS